MTPSEHLFENALFHYAKTGEFKLDKENQEWLNSDKIDSVRDCLQYVIYTLFDGDKEQLAKILNNDMGDEK